MSKKQKKQKIPNIEIAEIKDTKIAVTERFSFNYILECITRARHDLIFDQIKQKKYKSIETAEKRVKPLILKDIAQEILIIEKILSNLENEKEGVVNWNDHGLSDSIQERMATLKFMQKDIAEH